MKTATFNISGMHCASCAARNERTLKKLEGVLDASVNFATHSARVVFDDAVVSVGALYDVVVLRGNNGRRPQHRLLGGQSPFQDRFERQRPAHRQAGHLAQRHDG